MDNETMISLYGRSALGVELTILRMSENFGRAGGAKAEPGWWVLALGESLDPEDFGSRERAREKLRLWLEGAGVRLPEYVWVWDDTSQAQVVLATCSEYEKALAIAARLEEAGIGTRVTREFE